MGADLSRHRRKEGASDKVWTRVSGDGTKVREWELSEPVGF